MTMDEADRQAVHGVRDWYNEIAVEFERRYEGAGGDFWRVFEESLAFELLGNPGRRILDLGCGPGRLSKSLSQRAPFVLATDIAIAMVALAQRTKPAPNVHYCVMDATRLALKPGTIDEVISLGMFEYL
ncbi:MAG TPA: class I SAM-dependent methyltransferase, partial [Thermoanaerobaculia bacterium]|nr:class I SAM-dependent methyltransferase [Thermoanaerobaculia bacterium]